MEDEGCLYPLDELVRIVKRLRSDDGCPWDKEQDHRSLRSNLIEEAYEVLETIEDFEPRKMREELGDLLLQIVFHSELAFEEGWFDLNDVVATISAKLRRRHPHVFGDQKVDDVDEVMRNWERIKAEEDRASPPDRDDGWVSILDDLPVSLPALMLAERVQKRAADRGFDWSDIRGVLETIDEELGEFRAALEAGDAGRIQDELGDLLFSIVNLARFVDRDPELTLRQAVRKFTARFGHIERSVRARGEAWEELSMEELERLWVEAKMKE